jgi:hypothetical protein
MGETMRSLVTLNWKSRAVSWLGAEVAEGVGEAEAAVARLLVVMERTPSRSFELAMGMARLMSLLASTSVEAGELPTLLRVRSGQARRDPAAAGGPAPAACQATWGRGHRSASS